MCNNLNTNPPIQRLISDLKSKKKKKKTPKKKKTLKKQIFTNNIIFNLIF